MWGLQQSDRRPVAMIRRFRAARFRTNERRAQAVRRHRCRQRARRWRKRAIEAHFAEAHDTVERIVRQGADGGHHGERNRQIVMGPLFRHVGRREIAHFEVAALKRDQLGALLEQRIRPVRFDLDVALERLGECGKGLHAQIGFGRSGAQLHLGRRRKRHARQHRSDRKRRGRCKQAAAADGMVHWLPPGSGFFDTPIIHWRELKSIGKVRNI